MATRSRSLSSLFIFAVLLAVLVPRFHEAYAAGTNSNAVVPPFMVLTQSAEARGLIDKALALWETSKRKEGLQTADLEAEHLLKRVVTDFRGTEECAEALRHLAFGYRWKGMKAESDAAYDALFKDYPTSIQRAQAWLDLKGFSIQEGNLDKAWECYRNVLDNFPGTEYAQEALDRPPDPSCQYEGSVNFTSLPEGATCDGVNKYLRGTVLVKVEAGDLDGVSKIEIWVDNEATPRKTCPFNPPLPTTAPCEYSWNTALDPDGVHRVSAKMYDRCNNMKEIGPFDRNVDNTPPACMITYPTGQWTTVHGVSSTVRGEAQDAGGVREIRLYLDVLDNDQYRLDDPQEQCAAPCTITWNTCGKAEATHTLYARAFDCAGNTATSSQIINVHNTGCSGSQYHASAVKTVTNLRGAEADIKCRAPKLCHEAAAPPFAFSLACANVSRGQNMWAQIGWIRLNLKENNVPCPPWRTVYCEAASPNPITGQWERSVIYKHEDAGDNHTDLYRVWFYDVPTGRWHFIFNTYWTNIQQEGWKNKLGDGLSWQGEIGGKETDMASAGLDNWSFQDCQYNVQGSPNWIPAALSENNMFSSDRYNWASGSSLPPPFDDFNIQDCSPRCPP